MSGGLSAFDGRRERRAGRRTDRQHYAALGVITEDPTLAMVYRAASWALEAVAKDSRSDGRRKDMQYRIVLAEVRQNFAVAFDGKPHTVGATGAQPA